MRRNSIFFRSLALSFLLTMILGIAGTIYAQEVWSLEDCINYAIDNNIRIKQSELNAESYEDDWQQSKLALLPSLNASASHSYGWGRSIDLATYEYTDKQTQQNYFSASSEVNIFNGLQKFNLIKRDLYNYMASKYDSDKMRDDISLQIAAAYLQILFSKEMLDQTKEQVAVTKLESERTQKLVDAGTL
ncbi:MAG: TolC family protein, partial [Bacteroidales bacterium]|nr:TolC family protein [Bacteroidales bacterium]